MTGNKPSYYPYFLGKKKNRISLDKKRSFMQCAAVFGLLKGRLNKAGDL
ncbi:hypothetical protein ADIAL_1564 [Alkalibacterium sp. AK22]|nr:hypothetical protein ADIAL_1564 [Alkalibacterium sp. AK22]